MHFCKTLKKFVPSNVKKLKKLLSTVLIQENCFNITYLNLIFDKQFNNAMYQISKTQIKQSSIKKLTNKLYKISTFHKQFTKIYKKPVIRIILTS